MFVCVFLRFSGLIPRHTCTGNCKLAVRINVGLNSLALDVTLPSAHCKLDWMPDWINKIMKRKIRVFCRSRSDDACKVSGFEKCASHQPFCTKTSVIRKVCVCVLFVCLWFVCLICRRKGRRGPIWCLCFACPSLQGRCSVSACWTLSSTRYLKRRLNKTTKCG